MNKALQLVQLLRSTKRDARLGTVILFVTSRCNAFCKTCFYHEELNQPGDLTFAQIAKVSMTMPSITDLWLSGGEPTLRRDCSEIIDTFVQNNSVSRVIIPTNGLNFNIVHGETLVGDEIKQVPVEVLPAMYAYISKLTRRYGGRMFASSTTRCAILAGPCFMSYPKTF